ncbi:unnamed protein product, partial [Pylaiella littoralis]
MDTGTTAGSTGGGGNGGGGGGGGGGSGSGRSPGPGERRKSCNLCCNRKRRCDGDGVNPCSLCTHKHRKCTYSKKGRRGPKPKPKPKCERDGDGSFMSETEGVGDEDGQPALKRARVEGVVRLTPANSAGALGPQENSHLDSFFDGFGACMQIVQEDEIRGAMIHVLSEGSIGMPNAQGWQSSSSSFSSPSSSPSFSSSSTPGFFSGEGGAAGGSIGGGGGGSGGGSSVQFVRLEEGRWGVSAGMAGGGDSEEDLKRRGERARLSAGVACLWAGIGVGAMLRGQTAEATSHYAENAREAIKGCFDVVSEEILRAFLCLAHMHSFREDFPKFFRYTAMANDIAASLDREDIYPSETLPPPGYRGPSSKGCSEPAKFLLKCFDAMGHFLELEGEEANAPIDGLIDPQSTHDSSG